MRYIDNPLGVVHLYSGWNPQALHHKIPLVQGMDLFIMQGNRLTRKRRNANRRRAEGLSTRERNAKQDRNPLITEQRLVLMAVARVAMQSYKLRENKTRMETHHEGQLYRCACTVELR